ncbi:MAG: hypothetical protein IMW96_11005 [Thermoanaerobacteraceae bacterium]|nr:hypothetical protein [Thermoanaerobacteraceae bacterium]
MLPQFDSFTEYVKFYGGMFVLWMISYIALYELAAAIGFSPALTILSIPLAFSICMIWLEKEVNGLYVAKKCWEYIAGIVIPGRIFTRKLSPKEKAGGYLDFVDFGGDGQ